jgi:CHAT domain-containing protein/tetratricopeptide (TPR) repeat protein
VGSSRWSSALAVVSLAMTAVGCQTIAMSTEEARKVTTAFSGSPLSAPPRTLDDILQILEDGAQPNLAKVTQLRNRADAQPAATAHDRELAEFYYQRGLVANEISRHHQALQDFTRAAELIRGQARDASSTTLEVRIFERLAYTEMEFGDRARGIEHERRRLRSIPSSRRLDLMGGHCRLARILALEGDLKASKDAYAECTSIYREFDRVPLSVESRSWWEGLIAVTEGRLASAQGKMDDAERAYRRGLVAFARNPEDPTVQYESSVWRSNLALALAWRGRLLEAEAEGRSSLLEGQRLRGRNSVRAGSGVGVLARIMTLQGRHQDAERLRRIQIDAYEKAGLEAGSGPLNLALLHLGEVLVTQGRWSEGLAEFEGSKRALGSRPQAFRSDPVLAWAVALIKSGRPDEALAQLRPALEGSRLKLGATHAFIARIRGVVAMALRLKGDRAAALREFTEAISVLLANPPSDLEQGAVTPDLWYRRLILDAYIELLLDIQGSAIEATERLNATDEIFRIAEAVRAGSVHQALSANAARAAARDPALADLVRREQDAGQQLRALEILLLNTPTGPTQGEPPHLEMDLRGQIETLSRAHQTLGDRIARDHPAYSQLMNPPPATLGQARAALRPGEAWLVTYTNADRTLVWAIPASGAAAFAVVPLGEGALGREVRHLRSAFDAPATTVGTIPPFDVARAYRLYQTLLEPVKSGWANADTLLVVAHGALGQFPLGVLPTRGTMRPERGGLVFENYRDVAWLGRTVAIAVQPSVTALRTLRALAPGKPDRRPFIGFGDPWFNVKQAEEARIGRSAEPVPLTGVLARGEQFVVRRSMPQTQGQASVKIGGLPRLPETADEIRRLGIASGADPSRDIFLGAAANEKAVKEVDLSRYRVVAFATHGLVPGELDGLAEPALAFSAPEVAGVEGDGLLTLGEILALRLDADSIVLSACNTASGDGAGAEAVSGLGRAFFYAGARSLLVSHWAVETTSAAALTTEYFRRQQSSPSVGRARLLQEATNAMIDHGTFVDQQTNRTVFSYAHPIFWAPFTLVGDTPAATLPLEPR